jgi:hypothetical protein
VEVRLTSLPSSAFRAEVCSVVKRLLKLSWRLGREILVPLQPPGYLIYFINVLLAFMTEVYSVVKRLPKLSWRLGREILIPLQNLCIL